MIRLPPAHAHIWMNCAASPALSAKYPPVEGELSEAALEGKAIHYVAEQMLKAFKGSNEAPLFTDLVGSFSPQGLIITQEFFDCAREYVNDVVGYCNAHSLLPQLFVEQRVDLSNIIDGQHGYIDVAVHDRANKKIIVWDLKTGHRIVDPVDNWQLIIYAAAIRHLIGDLISPHEWQFYSIELRIVQPRAYHRDGIVRTWKTGSVIMTDRIEKIREQAVIARSDSPLCTTGKHCNDCPGNGHCDAYQRVIYDGVDYVMSLMSHDLSPHELGIEIKLLRDISDRVKNRLVGLEQQAIAACKSGQNVTGYTVENAYGRTRWRKDTPTDEIIMMADLMGVDVRKPVELDTPNQVMKKGIDESVIKAYIETPSTGLKLVPVDTNNAKLVFGGK